MDKQQDALLERLVETSNPKVIGAFEPKIAKLENDKLLLADKLAQDTQPALPLGKIIELLRDFLSNPWNIYEKGSLLARKTILKASFRAPSAYNRKTGYRTPQTSAIFRFLGDLKEKCEMVPRRRLELPRPFGHWHLKPARLPIPPPGQAPLRQACDVYARQWAVNGAFDGYWRLDTNSQSCSPKHRQVWLGGDQMKEPRA